MSAAVERARSPGSSTLLLAAARRRRRHRALDRGAVAGDDDLARRVDVRDVDHLALRRLRAHLPRRRPARRPGARPSRPVPTGTASCMNSPRLRTSAHGVREASAPATTSAEYSPRLWPAARSGVRPRSASAAAAATLAVSTAGWVLAVSVSSASGPLEAEAREREAERLVGLVARRRRRPARPRRTRAPMPTACEPWPGKRNAIFIARSRDLPAEQRRAPGEAAAERGEEHEVAGAAAASVAHASSSAT